MTPRSAAAVAAVVLLVALVAVAGLSTPWSLFARGVNRVRPQITGDFSDEERQRGQRYHRSMRPPAYLASLSGLVLAVVLGLTTAGARVVETVARPFGTGWGGRLLCGALAFVVISSLLNLPFGVWSERLRRRAGLSVQTWRSWSIDQLKGLAVGVVLLLLVLPPAFAVIRHAPRWWWVFAAAGAVGLTVLLSFVFPIVVEPVFNRFRPLDAGSLRTELLELARHDALPVREVLVADASRRTTALNAYVSGFGATRRIVVYDTLLTRASPQEVRLVVAHELGHAKHRDVLRGTLIGSLAAALGAIILYLVLTSPSMLHRAGADAAGDPRSLGLTLLVVMLFGVVSGPAFNLMSRRVEARADLHSLDLTRDPVTFADSERRLVLTNLADLEPPLFVRVLFGTHPTAPERIALARTWAGSEGLPVPGPLLDRVTSTEVGSEGERLAADVHAGPTTTGSVGSTDPASPGAAETGPAGPRAATPTPSGPP